jgi:hypothetical protein
MNSKWRYFHQRNHLISNVKRLTNLRKEIAKEAAKCTKTVMNIKDRAV